MKKSSLEELRTVLKETSDILYHREGVDKQALDERTRELARPPQDDELTGPDAIRGLIFTLGGGRYAWPIHSVKAITQLERVTPVPTAPHYYAGVISFRGRILSILNLHTYMGLTASSSTLPFVILIEGEGLEVGVLAGDVFDVVNIARSSLVAASGLDTELITGVTPDGLTLLDAAALLKRERKRVESGV